MVFVLVSLACRLPLLSEKQNSLPTVPVSVEAAESVEQIIEQALSEPGIFAFTLTEEELTSYLTLNLLETQDDYTVENLAMRLDDDRATMTADVTINSMGIQTPAEMVLRAEVSETGELSFVLESLKAGSISLPNSIQQSISQTITDAMESQITPQLSGVQLDTVFIDDGMLTVSGIRQ